MLYVICNIYPLPTGPSRAALYMTATIHTSPGKRTERSGSNVYLAKIRKITFFSYQYNHRGMFLKP